MRMPRVLGQRPVHLGVGPQRVPAAQVAARAVHAALVLTDRYTAEVDVPTCDGAPKLLLL